MDIRRRFLSIFNKNTIDDYLTIEALEDGLTVSLSLNDCEYSIDGINNWKTVAAGTAAEPINTGQTISFRGNLSPVLSYGIGTFTVTKNFNLKGNAMSMLYGNSARYYNKTKGNYTFYKLFYGCKTLIDMSKDFLPATIVGFYSYYDMFRNCSNLLSVPLLPATTLDVGSYRGMFNSCSSITKAPELPATTVYGLTYYLMFENCTNLVTGPSELPATTIGYNCYASMFRNCSKLINTPSELPALTLFEGSYQSMYDGCSSITKAPELMFTTVAKDSCYFMFENCSNLVQAPSVLKATTLATSCYNSMFYGCSKLTTAPELWGTELADSCYAGMFSYCTLLQTVPLLPTTKLARLCYRAMFNMCTNLVEPTQLSATTLFAGCYMYMFAGCSNLVSTPYLPATSLAPECYYGMFLECSSLTEIASIEARTLANNCCYRMFYKCINIIHSPELPAIELADSCYSGMFRGCSNLLNSPELPATTLAPYCYCDMFADCTSLTTAPELPATTLTNVCYSGMFLQCKSLTEAPELPATTLASSCYNGMFIGCSNIKSISLPATTLTDSCYKLMLHSSGVNYIEMLAQDISATNCLDGWVTSVSNTGTFLKSVFMNDLPTGVNGIPDGWIVQDDFTITECINLVMTADDVIGNNTATILHVTMTVNGTDRNGLFIEGIVVNKTIVSDLFDQNLSETDTVVKTISYTYMGLTATTTFNHLPYIACFYTLDLNNNWRLSTSIANPDEAIYDGVYESFSNYNIHNDTATMYIDIVGYTNFKLYIRSYAESSYDYVMVSLLDLEITGSTTPTDSVLVKDHTRARLSSGTSISSYRLVEYSDISPEAHRITIVYRKDVSGNTGDDRGYILIPKNQ